MTKQTVLSRNFSAFGDVNPLTHGGLWIKRELYQNEYQVIQVSKMDYEEPQCWITEIMTVDIMDTWIDKEKVCDFVGLPHNFDIMDDSLIVNYISGLISFYPTTNFGLSDYKTFNLTETRALLKDYGIKNVNKLR